MRIYHCPRLGVHIDLDHVLEMTSPMVDDRMGFGGWFVGHAVRFAFRDEMVWYERGFSASDEWHLSRTWEEREPLESEEFAAAIEHYRQEVWQPMYDAWVGG